MTHVGRTHGLSIAWLHEQLKSKNVKMYRADGELMAADIFTKPFPEGKASAWNNNLRLINIASSDDVAKMDYSVPMVQSIRGDLDEPKCAPIDNADLGNEDDEHGGSTRNSEEEIQKQGQ